jgi:hypothetical protein
MTQQRSTVTGELYRVDTHSGQFRIEDDLGTSIGVVVAGEPGDVAGLVGQRVEVRGDAEYDHNGRLLRVKDASVVSCRLAVDSTVFAVAADLDDVVSQAQPFDSSEERIQGVDADEMDAFMATIRS